MRIIELAAENFMGVEAVDITPDTDVVVIGGKNGAGKSSVLNAILAALGGAKALPSKPIRQGEQSGRVQVVLRRDEGDLVVERTFDGDKTKLVVRSADGAKYGRPQELLDTLVGAIGFDPHAFCRLDQRRQADQLRELVGVRTDDVEASRSAAYEARTAVNREAKAIEARVAAMPQWDGVPADPVSVADLMREARRREQVQDENAKARRDADHELADAAHEIGACQALEDKIQAARLNVRAMESALRARQESVGEKQDRANAAIAAARELVDPDVEEVRQQIEQAEETNACVRANAERAALLRSLDERRREADRLTAAVEAADAEKARRLAEAEWPVDGLGIGPEGQVTYRGLPLSQASSAEQLRVSLAMGMAANPKLRVLICRDGSLIDDDTMAVIREMVARHDYQLWVERVSGTGEGCSLVISEGRVAPALAAT